MDFRLQQIGKEQGGRNSAFAVASRTIFAGNDIEGRTYPLAGNLHQPELAQGQDIKAPRYVPNGTGVSIPHSLHVPSDKIIVVEGIATMYEDVKDVFDVKIYIETESDIRRDRIIRRAVSERNQDEQNALKHWEYLLHAGEKYVKPCREYADFVLDGNSDLHYLDQILEYIHVFTNNFQ